MLIERVEAVRGQVGYLRVVEERVERGDDRRGEEGRKSGGGVVEICVCDYADEKGEQTRGEEG